MDGFQTDYPVLNRQADEFMQMLMNDSPGVVRIVHEPHSEVVFLLLATGECILETEMCLVCEDGEFCFRERNIIVPRGRKKIKIANSKDVQKHGL